MISQSYISSTTTSASRQLNHTLFLQQKIKKNPYNNKKKTSKTVATFSFSSNSTTPTVTQSIFRRGYIQRIHISSTVCVGGRDSLSLTGSFCQGGPPGGHTTGGTPPSAVKSEDGAWVSLNFSLFLGGNGNQKRIFPWFLMFYFCVV